MNVPTKCVNSQCPHIRICGEPDFPGTKEVCTVYYECALGFSNSKDCIHKATPREKLLSWYRGRKR